MQPPRAPQPEHTPSRLLTRHDATKVQTEGYENLLKDDWCKGKNRKQTPWHGRQPRYQTAEAPESSSLKISIVAGESLETKPQGR
jgi:hypothetical protein